MMGGYNTVSEVLQAGVPALVVPRVRPSSEQLIRANGLAEAGLADMVHPDDITPQLMWQAIVDTAARQRQAVEGDDYRGAERTAQLLVDLTRDAGQLAQCAG
jgi:predicted glycosyltransferase